MSHHTLKHKIAFTVSYFIYLRDDVDDAITVDIHFQQSTMVKYRTSVVFDWLDLMGLYENCMSGIFNSKILHF